LVWCRFYSLESCFERCSETIEPFPVLKTCIPMLGLTILNIVALPIKNLVFHKMYKNFVPEAQIWKINLKYILCFSRFDKRQHIYCQQIAKCFKLKTVDVVWRHCAIKCHSEICGRNRWLLSINELVHELINVLNFQTFNYETTSGAINWPQMSIDW